MSGSQHLFILSLLAFLLYGGIRFEERTELEISTQSNFIENSSQCIWPPIYETIPTGQNTKYNISICIQLKPDAVPAENSKRYKLSDLFNVTSSNETVTFEDLANLQREVLINYDASKYF